MISELPNTWRRTAFELSRLAAKYRSSHDGGEAPARSDEYLYYQSLVGAVPFGAGADQVPELSERIQAYMLKASREAKTHTAWLHPAPEYEAALSKFVAGTLADAEFVATLLRFCRRIDSYAACKALGQVVLKLCSPGVPDTYQGSEIWHQVLVDPDNRRLVDQDALARTLAEIDRQRRDRRALAQRLLAHFADGAVKLFVVSELLRLRRDAPNSFRSGYLPLDAGPDVIAFGRGTLVPERESALDLLCVVPRFPFRVTRGRSPWPIGAVWRDQTLAFAALRGNYQNVFTGAVLTPTGSLELAQIFADFPVAVLVRRTDGSE